MDFTNNANDDSPYANIPTRPMRVKVLYSFDADNKTNCLARFPNTLQIPAVAIDESSQVGVIELRQCIQAVLIASPELIPRLSDGDFTVYAFDYSEFETPLVGQGMLSTAIVAAAASAENESEKTMITGRVCKNVPAIFSNGVKETLEVKLRLVPVPKSAQAVGGKAMDRTLDGSPAMSGGFDPNAWNASMHHNRPQQMLQDYFSFDATPSSNADDMALGDDVFNLGPGISGSQQMMAGLGATQTPTERERVYRLDPAFATNSYSAPGSRAGSPIVGLESSTFNEHLRHQSFSGVPSNFVDHSQPASRASVRSEYSSARHHQRQTSSQSLPPQPAQDQTELYFNEDGQPRKRARVMQTDWHGKASFGSRSSDLRITAAAANSVHMHRPIPKRATAPGSDLEPPPRVPTPVPQRNFLLQHQRAQQSAPARSMLRQASTVDSDFMSDFEQYSDALMSSPEEESPLNSTTAAGTPQDIPSSPPVFPGINHIQPSSPGLPTLSTPRMADSGYLSEIGLASGNVIDSLEDCDEMVAQMVQRGTASPRPRSSTSIRGCPLPTNAAIPLLRQTPFIKTEERASAESLVAPSNAAVSNEIEFQMVMPGDESQLPQKMRLSIPPRRNGSLGPKALKSTITAPALTVATLKGRAPASVPLVAPAALREQTSRPGPPQSRRSSLALPPNPTSDQAAVTRTDAQKPAPRRRPLKRSRTQADSEAGSPAPSDTEGRPRGPKRSGSGATRRMVIQDRLEQSLLSGEAPQFCANCGAIETPTWRRLYIKHVDGKPCPLDEAEGEGETIGLEATATDGETGEVTRFVIRKSLKRDKNSKLPKVGDDFEDTTLCNPCGLWFNKTRTMRPADRWGKKPTSRRSKKAKISDGGAMSVDGVEPQSEAFFTDAVGPDEGSEDLEGDELSNSITDTDREKSAGAKRLRASSLQPEQNAKDLWNASRLDAALTRQVQSSPVRFGSQTSPIEIKDLTPRPTRRLLFPSPRREGEVRSLDDNGQMPLNATPPTSKGGALQSSSSTKLAFTLLNTDVNVFEAFTCNKENIGTSLNDMDGLAGLFEGSPTSVFKTPRKTPSNSAATSSQRSLTNLLRTPTPANKRKPLSVDQNAANNAAMTNDFMTSPSSPRYFLRSTPSRAERTPGRISSRNELVSPFSRQLAQMLSDPNEPCAMLTSPSRGGGAFDFSDLPSFTTPGRQMDWSGIDDMLHSSEFAAFDDESGAQD